MDMDRRIMPRFPVNLTVNSVNHQELFGTIKDFSRKGMKVILDSPVPLDRSDIQIAIQRPDYNEQILATAFVVWEKSFEGKREVGLQFTNIPVQAKADLLEYGYKGWLKSRSGH
jgi:c-di-GMP-binding flagellar brake protein YcgR